MFWRILDSKAIIFKLIVSRPKDNILLQIQNRIPTDSILLALPSVIGSEFFCIWKIPRPRENPDAWGALHLKKEISVSTSKKSTLNFHLFKP